jgi:hypothetical protein
MLLPSSLSANFLSLNTEILSPLCIATYPLSMATHPTAFPTLIVRTAKAFYLSLADQLKILES